MCKNHIDKGFYCCSETTWLKNKLWGVRVYITQTSRSCSSSLEKSRTRTQRAEPGVSNRWSSYGEKMLPDLIPLACSANFLKDKQPRDDTTDHEVNPFPLIHNWENASQLNLMGSYSQLNLLPFWWLWLVSS